MFVPNLEWYASVSEKRHVSVRCPHASTSSCPRYYQSLSLLKGAGFTGIPESEDRRLLKYWMKSELWPQTDEHATSIFGFDGRASIFSSFCPEVIFDGFGYFSTFLAGYSDEIDRSVMHKTLVREKASNQDYRWNWADLSPQHYTECPLYSVISHNEKRAKDSPWWREHLAVLIIGVIVATVTALVTKFLA